eukprot:TRINITY_DN982_c0_g1_i1.p2 TRINITY_DN982_c0_g1~~TRINITY_DN982_c0_g1_i1.p2  ORF type:complete len:259 (-),score=28.21 TRINITY_DN982_c0_g1_i1:59-835(-)
MQITITRPDDWHLHLRDGEALASVLAHTARQFGRAIVMPNLKPPVTTVEQAAAYRDRIVAALPAGASFEPLMTLYLTDNMPASEITKAAASGFVKAVKLYPAGATTNSDAGLTDIAKAYDTLAEMERVGLPLLVHGEVTDPKASAQSSSAAQAVQQPAQPQAASLAPLACGAESVPRKNFGLPEIAAATSASRWVSRFSTGRQYQCGRTPPWKMALRLQSRWWTVMVAATLAGELATNSAASLVVMCSMTTFLSLIHI